MPTTLQKQVIESVSLWCTDIHPCNRSHSVLAPVGHTGKQAQPCIAQVLCSHLTLSQLSVDLSRAQVDEFM